MFHQPIAPTPDSTVHRDFAATVQRSPEAIAVNDPNGEHTYAATAELTHAIRCHLQTHSVTRGDLVALVLDRDITLPASIMAIFETGAAYLPLEKDDPTDRHLQALDICKCKCVLGTRSAILPLREAVLKAGLTQLPDFIAVEDILPTTGDGPLAQPSGPNDLAYVLLTSGSTGTPKAVNISHANIQSHLISAVEALEFSAADRYLSTTPLTFDPSISEIFLPLVAGGATVLRNRNLILDPKQLCAEMRAAGVTVAAATPSTWATVIKASGDAFPHLHAVVTHGEPIPPAFARVLATKADRAMNLYGPTEATVWATGHQMLADAPDPVSKTSAPIGLPLKGFTILVRDEAGRDVGPNELGELILGGPNIALGYRNDPEKTAAVFFEEDGIRFYRTGDLVLRRTDGVIEYMGRIDDQMAINGSRIEPGEVESAILTHASVASCAVTWYPQQDDSRGIVAAVVPKPGTALDPGTLRSYLGTRLARNMVPTRYQILAALPVLTSGKIDRKAIRASAVEANGDAIDLTPPDMTETESTIAAIWRDLLQVDHITPDDEFFLIGGDSLAAVEMVTLLEAELGRPVSIELILETPQLRAFAAAVEADTSAQAAQDATVIRVKSAASGTPLFFALADYGYAGRAGQAIPCPFYNLTIWNRSDGILHMKSLDDLATRYRTEIQAQQPHGPYRLAGYSVGGILAFEVARQLIDAGESIASLFLLDPTPPTKLELHKGTIIDGAGRMDVRRSLSAGYMWEAAKRHARRAPLDLKNLTWLPDYRRVDRALKSGDGSQIDRETRHRAMVYALGRMAARHVARPLDAPITVVAGNDEIAHTWARLVPADTMVHRLDSGHRDIFKSPLDGQWTRVLLDVLAKDGADEQLQAAAE